MRDIWQPRHITGVPDGLVLFDGVCVLCSGWVKFIIRHDPDARFRFLAIQTDVGRALAARLSIDPGQPQTNAIILNGIAYFKSDAALQVLARLGGFRWFSILSVIPRRLRNFCYDRVALNRYALFGRTDACLIPTQDLARHFVEVEFSSAKER